MYWHVISDLELKLGSQCQHKHCPWPFKRVTDHEIDVHNKLLSSCQQGGDDLSELVPVEFVLPKWPAAFLIYLA